MLNLYKICSKMHGVMEKVRYTPGIRNNTMTTCLIQLDQWDLGNMKVPFFGLLLLDTDQEQPKKDAFWK